MLAVSDVELEAPSWESVSKDFHPGWVDSVGRREVGKCINLESGVVSTENPELEVCPRAA